MHIINPYRYAGGGTSPGTTNLASWWSMDETSGTRSDSHGSVDLTEFNTVGYATGKQNNAADFERGNSEYLINTSAAALDPSGGDITITGWIKPESIAPTWVDVNSIIALTNSTSSNAIVLRIYAADHPTNPNQIRVGFNNGTSSTETYGPALSAGTWYQFLISLKASTGETSLQINNGTAITNTMSGSLRASITKVFIGTVESGGTPVFFYDGLVDEVNVYHQLFSDDEKTWMYNGGAGRAYGDL